MDLGDRDLYRRLQHAAVDLDVSVRQIVIEAVTYWLDHVEEVEAPLATQVLEKRWADESL